MNQLNFEYLQLEEKSIMNRKYLVIYLVNKAQPHSHFKCQSCLPIYIGNGGFYQGRMSLLHTVRKFHAETLFETFSKDESNSKKKSGTSRVFRVVKKCPAKRKI
ncbi:hypothetical protein CEXT_154031 [Caerostris extrusa]|uniref:GIY-YIG homing endonuclease n=1 Tax=Caerostris extrusa TaxID=172846 RepID=A0AAV4R188_CAEEX|nr:hypothetical protein CEXT_154031 [Caerostris extrusa]